MKVIKRCFVSAVRFVICILECLFFPLILMICFVSRFSKRKIDIGMGPQPLINYVYWEKALKRKGYSVESFVTSIYYITDEFDCVYKGFRKFIITVEPLLLFFRCIYRYKCLYIFFDGGPLWKHKLFRNLEPFLLNLANIKIVVMPYGSDTQIFERTKNKLVVHYLCQDYPQFFQKKHEKILKQVEMWSKASDIVVGSMDSIDYLHYWNRVRQCHFAIDTDKIVPNYKTLGDTIKIFHAPNHREIKGSKFIENSIRELKEEGYKIEYVYLSGVSNKEILDAMQEADIVIDQLIMGWYAMFAMEAMACGKPTICYLRKDLVELYETIGCIEKDEIPLISSNPVALKDTLVRLIERKEQWNEIGHRSREYVEKYHSLDSVGIYFDEINRSIGIIPHHAND